MKVLEEMYDILKPLAKAIAEAMGPNCEVVLHSLDELEHSIVAIENGHITGRKVGDSSTNLGMQVLKKGLIDNDMLNYTSTTKDGKTLKSSSIYIRNNDGVIIGALCINYNITDFMMATNVINEFIKTEKKVDETYAGDINEIIQKLLEDAVSLVGKPVPFMQKEDKLRVLKFLDEKGVFTVKRSIDRVALFFDVSKYTIYNYLEEIRIMEENNII